MWPVANGTGPTAIYVRISDDPELQRLGVKRQERDCRALATELGWKVGHVYEDNDMSAFKEKVRRPAYEQLLADLEAGTWHRLIIWASDRLYRRAKELERIIPVLEN